MSANPTRTRKALLLVTCVVAIGLVIAAYALLREGDRENTPVGATTADGDNAGESTAITPAAAPSVTPVEETLGDLDSLIEDSQIEDDMAGVLDRVAERARVDFDSLPVLPEDPSPWQELWYKEDSVRAEMPTYEEMELRMLGEAGDLIRALENADTESIQQLAETEMDVFWDKGSLAEPEAYEHVYLARAILESAIKDRPDDFQLLSQLREAIGAMIPRHHVDYSPNMEAYEALWPIVEKQETLIRSGRVPLSPEAMLAMYDWSAIAPLVTKDRQAGIPALQWIVENATDGKWANVKTRFERAIACIEKNIGYGMNLYTLQPDADLSQEERGILYAQVSRLLSSHRGPKKFRENSVGLWELPERPLSKLIVTHSRTIVTGSDPEHLTVVKRTKTTEEVE